MLRALLLSCTVVALCAAEPLVTPLTPATSTLWVQTADNPAGTVVTQGDGTITVVPDGVDLVMAKLGGMQLAVFSLPVVSAQLVAGTTYRFRCVMRATPQAAVIVAYPEHAWEKKETTPPSANTTWHQVEGGDTVVTGDFRYTPGINRDTVALIFSPEHAQATFAVRALSLEPVP